MLGPSGRYTYLQSPSTLPEHWIHAGGSVGYALSFGGSFTLLPEVGVLQSLCCDTLSYAGPVTGPQRSSYNARIAFVFGQRFAP